MGSLLKISLKLCTTVERSQHGVNGLIGFGLKKYQQCREERQETSTPPTLFQSYRQIPQGYDEARIYRRIRGNRRSPWRQNCCQFDRSFEQSRYHLPQIDVGISDIEKWTNNLLPSRQFGYIVMTTSGGIMDHEEARRNHLGGKILGFFF